MIKIKVSLSIARQRPTTLFSHWSRVTDIMVPCHKQSLSSRPKFRNETVSSWNGNLVWECERVEDKRMDILPTLLYTTSLDTTLNTLFEIKQIKMNFSGSCGPSYTDS